MKLVFSQSWVLAVLLTSVRIGVLLLLTPVFNALQGLATVRILFAIVLGALLVPTNYPMLLAQLSSGEIMLAAAAEAAVGFALAYGVVIAFGAFSVAGKIIEVQIGLGIGNVYDPVTRRGAPLLGTLLNMLGLAVFYELGGHHLLLRGVAYSFQQVPLGQGLRLAAAEPVLMLFGLMFSLGVALIAPVLLSLLLVEAGLAVLARVLPQMNVFAISTPAKSLGGFILLALNMRVFGVPMNRIYASIFTFWEGILG